MSNYAIQRTTKEIEELIDQCAEARAMGKSKYPRMTYEDGIRAAIEWLTDKQAEHPLDD